MNCGNIPETALGLSPIWWTAVGVISALLMATVPPICRGIVRRLRRPRLLIDVEGAKKYSSATGTGDGKSRFWFRIPIRNSPLRRYDAASNVEVFLEEVYSESTEKKQVAHPSAPMRITWCHTGKAICDRIPAGSFRLLDLGSYPLEMDQEISFQFGGEVQRDIPSITSFRIPPGAQLTLKLSISCDGIPTNSETFVLRRTLSQDRHELVMDRQSLFFERG